MTRRPKAIALEILEADSSDRLWSLYDLSGLAAFDLRVGRRCVVVDGGGDVARNSEATDELVRLLDELRRLVRERIEADAAAGKAAGR